MLLIMLLIPLCTSHMNNNTASQAQLINTLFIKEHLHLSHHQAIWNCIKEDKIKCELNLLQFSYL